MAMKWGQWKQLSSIFAGETWVNYVCVCKIHGFFCECNQWARVFAHGEVHELPIYVPGEQSSGVQPYCSAPIDLSCRHKTQNIRDVSQSSRRVSYKVLHKSFCPHLLLANIHLIFFHRKFSMELQLEIADAGLVQSQILWNPLPLGQHTWINRGPHQLGLVAQACYRSDCEVRYWGYQHARNLNYHLYCCHAHSQYLWGVVKEWDSYLAWGLRETRIWHQSRF